ncbi:MAG TPA: aquaporin [Gemmatimonadales bacterium]|nr:aquaporin [Gemmatimonadales bacterium]
MNLKVARPIVAEFVGTALFVFLGTASIVANYLTSGQIGMTGVALTHGVAMAIIVTATLRISGGHINPAVTAALYVARKVDGRTAGMYVVAQIFGAILGSALLKWLLPHAAVAATSYGAPALSASTTFSQGIWIEAVLTFFLVSAVFGTAVSKEAPAVGGFGIGLAIFVAILAGGDFTGAAMNPARAFGPALLAGEMHGQAVYWIGPLIGALVAALLWRFVLLPKDPAAL